MKKKILGGIAVLAIAVVAAFNVNINVNIQENGLSDISLENVETLAYGEASSTYYSSQFNKCGTGGSSVCRPGDGW